MAAWLDKDALIEAQDEEKVRSANLEALAAGSFRQKRLADPGLGQAPSHQDSLGSPDSGRG